MLIHTHFEVTQQFPSQDVIKLVNLWKKSWENNGWTIIVTGDDFIKSRLNDRARRFCERVESFPSANAPGFDRAAFRRWLAGWFVSQDVGQICSTEPDLINYSFTEDSFKELKLDHSNLNVADTDDCPVFFFTDSDRLGKFIDMVANHELKKEDEHQGKPHLSDQDFLRRYCSKEEWYHSFAEVAASMMKTGWKEKSLVHYGNPFLYEYGFIKQDGLSLPKEYIIQNLRPVY
jgi:hypothetical protein